jgi:hypothetical protein
MGAPHRTATGFGRRQVPGWKMLFLVAAAGLTIAGCRGSSPAPAPSSAAASAQPGQFASDVSFLRAHTEIVLLTDASGVQVAVAPAYQGRVMTSTTGGSDAPSFGWIGRAAVASGTRQPHMNVFGGEDRFWLGPEGGQYALYFKPGDPFDIDHWQVPAAFDWDRWDVASRSESSVRFRKHMALVNYASTPIELDVDRTVRLVTPADAAAQLGISPGAGVRMVAFESTNTITNAGKAAWQPESGLVSIWILGQFTPSPDATIVIPFKPGPEPQLGPIVNDAYFGKVPAHRLVVRDSVLFLKADGQYRSKIGIPAPRALTLAGSYDAAGRTLTLVQYTRPAGAARYVNSMWDIQRQPYGGDVVNSYNDGPVAPGAPPLGPFYEIETSSPALSLAPGESHTHVHRTFHFVGAEADLDRIARATLGAGLSDITSAFRH